MIDIDALEALAKAATSGLPGDRIPFALHAMDPEGMLALIAEVRALRNLESAVRDHRAMYEGTSDEDNMSALSIGDAISQLDAARKEETC